VVDGDISAYRDQCLGAMWLTGRKWVDLCLWAPDLADIGRDLTIVRIERDDNEIQALDVDLIAFHKRVDSLTKQLQKN
jgi:exodeoxyribonuclease (lambda-induced)